VSTKRSWPRPGWAVLLASGFDPDVYSGCLPAGRWEAVVETSAWGKRAPGIHVYLLNRFDGCRYRWFVPWARHELYEFFRRLPDGSPLVVQVVCTSDPRKARVVNVARAVPPGVP
jgi:hypothetical protein